MFAALLQMPAMTREDLRGTNPVGTVSNRVPVATRCHRLSIGPA